MPNSRKNTIQTFHLPEIRRNTIQIDRQSFLFPRGKNSLSKFQQQLKHKDKKYNSLHQQQKKRSLRLKTINVNDEQTYDSLRRELRSMKQQMSYKMNEYNHKLASKIDDFVMFSAMKKDQPVVYQPFPIYLPPMYPQQPMMPMYMPPGEDGGSPYQQYPNPRQFPAKRQTRPIRASSRFKLMNFRKAVHAVLFTFRLRKFVEKVINFRKQMFQKYLNDTNEFKQEANFIKKILVQGLKPLLVTLLQKEDTELKLNEGDSENFKKEKIQQTKKFFQMLIDCLKKTIQSEAFDSIIRSVYYFCRHGSYACSQKMLTQEQLENISVSEKHYYLQAQKNLQKSQIINFLFMKILIYNALGQSWKIDPNKFSKEKETLQDNILILCSILYEILMDIQDDFIVNSPECYPLNNYQNIKGGKIYPSESLTVKPGEYRKNEVISGLINENIVKGTYKLDKQWLKEKNSLTQIIQTIHEKVSDYHRNLIQQFL